MINNRFIMEWIVIIFGVIVISYAMRKIYYGRQAFSWPSAVGKMLTCSLESKKDRHGTFWKVKVLYSYPVAGYTFQCDRISFNYEGNYVQSYHEAIYNKLQLPAAQIMVRYQPSNPWMATLAPGIDTETYFLTACGIWLFLLGLLLLHPALLGCDSIWTSVFSLVSSILYLAVSFYCMFRIDRKLLRHIQAVILKI